MRSKLNVTLVLALFGLFSVATACGDDGSSSGGAGDAGDAGESAGGEGAMSSGGSANGGKAGSTSGVAGEPSSNGGNPQTSGGESGSSGAPVGNGGESGSGSSAGNGGESGTGPDPTGNGGEGGGGPVVCTEITLGQFDSIVAETYARYPASLTPNILGSGDDTFQLSVIAPPQYDGGATGTFDLTENGDENYATCSRCILVIADPDGDRTVFYPSQGTLVIDSDSMPLAGTIDATVTNLKLVEVTIANDYTSTPVPGGACLTLASGTIQAEPPPCEGFQCLDGECLPQANWQCDEEPDCDDGSDELPTNPLCVVPEGWECSEAYVGDGDCDCGCGAKDTDCSSTTNEAECEYCIACTGSFALCPANTVDPQDTTTCL
jgi:hypothetical protein